MQIHWSSMLLYIPKLTPLEYLELSCLCIVIFFKNMDEPDCPCAM